MSGPEDALHAFVGKWRARWPEWEIAERLLAPGHRDLAAAWFALLQEWGDAAFAGADPVPGRAKLDWWQEELRGWAKGARRHPLGVALAARAIDWPALADALSPLQSFAGEAAIDLATVAGWGRAVLDAEHGLFGGGRAPAAADDVASALLLATGREVPGSIRIAGSRPRRLWTSLLLARAKSGDARTPLPSWRVPWLSWRAARGTAG